MVTQRYWKSQTKANFSGSYALERDIKKGIIDTTYSPKNPYSVAMRRFGEVYRKYLRTEFDANKKGGREWAEIKDSTRKWRWQRHRIRQKQILYVTKTLYKVTYTRYNPSYAHYEKKTKYGITLGAKGGMRHPDFNGSIHRLLQIHARGNAKRYLPSRVVIKAADQATLDKMNVQMEKAHAAAVKRANRKA